MRHVLPISVALVLVLAPRVARSQDDAIVRRELADREEAVTTNFVFLAEGYRKDEADAFFSDAAKFSAHLLHDRAAAPIRSGCAMNFHYVFLASREHGPRQFVDDAPSRDTEFRSRTSGKGSQRVLLADSDKMSAVAARYAPGAVAVLVQRPEATPMDRLERFVFRGWREVRSDADLPCCGSRVRAERDDPECFIHELGHALFGLLDEYGDDHDGSPPAELSQWIDQNAPNLSVHPDRTKWSSIVSTPPIEGGCGYKKGVWRAERRCMMNDGTSDFCRVCKSVIASRRPSPPAPGLVGPLDGGATHQ
jgi:hypothetical protein